MTPLHTAALRARPVRFFRSPLDGPDFPWVALADLLAVGGYTPEGAAFWVVKWQSLFPEQAHDLAGVVIVPDVAARGFFEWAAASGWEEAADLLHAYNRISAELFTRLHGGGPMEEFVERLQEAVTRGVPAVGHAH